MLQREELEFARRMSGVFFLVVNEFEENVHCFVIAGSRSRRRLQQSSCFGSQQPKGILPQSTSKESKCRKTLVSFVERIV
jgi:hypothetical protein